MSYETDDYKSEIYYVEAVKLTMPKHQPLTLLLVR